MAGEIETYIAQQIIFELFVIITNAKRVESPLPLDIAAELAWIFGNVMKSAKSLPASWYQEKSSASLKARGYPVPASLIAS